MSQFFKLAALAACLFFSEKTFSQLSENFSDGNLDQNPTWVGDAQNFIVNSDGELQLKSPAAGSATLAVQTDIPDSAIWLLDFRLEFAPSTQNRLRVYLLADDANLSLSNSYFLEIGETGSADALRFFKQTAGGSAVLLATGTPATVGGDPAEGKIRMKKNAAGVWTLEFMPPSQAFFQNQFSVLDIGFPGGTGKFFGFQCTYTDTRKEHFFFDNISIQADLPDLTPPVAVQLQVLDSVRVRVFFDEEMDPVSTADPANYFVSGGIGQAQSAFFDAITKKTSILTLPKPLVSTQNYALSVSGAKDVAGNLMSPQTLDFQYFKIEKPVPGDLVFNEIMAAPSPSFGLPETEWIEFYNRSGKHLQLSDFFIADFGGIARQLPPRLVAPKSFVVVCPEGKGGLFPQIPDIQEFSAFPSLNNEADALRLTDVNGQLLEHVSYRDEWHTEFSKRAGGWSLERKNHGDLCTGIDFWGSAEALPGGTPGAENSIFDPGFADEKPPIVVEVFAETPTQIQIYFNEPMAAAEAVKLTNFEIRPERGISKIEFVSDSKMALALTLSEPLLDAVLYEILPGAAVTDCAGNSIFTQKGFFAALPQVPDFQDVVINELLFDPAPNGSRFVEILNRSQKFFRPDEFFIAQFFEGKTSAEKIANRTIFRPGEHLVFTANRRDVHDRFWVETPENLLLNDLPTWADDAGNASVYWAKNGQKVLLDSFDYSADWHNALLTADEKEGTSLERIRPSGLTNDPSNWTSAAAQNGLAAGTPTARNSQLKSDSLASEEELISLISKRLSPDGDGFEDFLEISFRLPEAGFAGTFSIFDSDGFLLKKLVRQELLGTEGTVRWDGDADAGGAVRPGIHVLFWEVFSPSGEVRRGKIPFSVLRKW